MIDSWMSRSEGGTRHHLTVLSTYLPIGYEISCHLYHIFSVFYAPKLGIYICLIPPTYLPIGYEFADGEESDGFVVIYIIFGVFYAAKLGTYALFKVAHKMDKVGK